MDECSTYCTCALVSAGFTSSVGPSRPLSFTAITLAYVVRTFVDRLMPREEVVSCMKRVYSTYVHIARVNAWRCRCVMKLGEERKERCMGGWGSRFGSRSLFIYLCARRGVQTYTMYVCVYISTVHVYLYHSCAFAGRTHVDANSIHGLNEVELH